MGPRNYDLKKKTLHGSRFDSRRQYIIYGILKLTEYCCFLCARLYVFKVGVEFLENAKVETQGDSSSCQHRDDRTDNLLGFCVKESIGFGLRLNLRGGGT